MLKWLLTLYINSPCREHHTVGEIQDFSKCTVSVGTGHSPPSETPISQKKTQKLRKTRKNQPSFLAVFLLKVWFVFERVLWVRICFCWMIFYFHPDFNVVKSPKTSWVSRGFLTPQHPHHREVADSESKMKSQSPLKKRPNVGITYLWYVGISYDMLEVIHIHIPSDI